jgi:hypothetical protein
LENDHGNTLELQAWWDQQQRIQDSLKLNAVSLNLKIEKSCTCMYFIFHFLPFSDLHLQKLPSFCHCPLPT